MMAQLLAHLWGDYILQSHWMALSKRKSTWACFVHCLLYAICFIPLIPPRGVDWRGLAAIMLIFWSHFFIDRFGLARYAIWVKNLIGPREARMPWGDCDKTGFPSITPDWLATWLLIIVDNTLHLTCNYIILGWK